MRDSRWPFDARNLQHFLLDGSLRDLIVMFSTNSLASPGVVSLRNPRRRQRNVSDESQKLPKAKRQRSALRHDLFEPVNNTDSELLDSSPKEFVVTTRSLSAEQGIHTGLKELTIQTSKKHDKRSDRSEGSVVLVSTHPVVECRKKSQSVNQ